MNIGSSDGLLREFIPGLDPDLTVGKAENQREESLRCGWRRPCVKVLDCSREGETRSQKCSHLVTEAGRGRDCERKEGT